MKCRLVTNIAECRLVSRGRSSRPFGELFWTFETRLSDQAMSDKEERAIARMGRDLSALKMLDGESPCRDSTTKVRTKAMAIVHDRFECHPFRFVRLAGRMCARQGQSGKVAQHPSKRKIAHNLLPSPPMSDEHAAGRRPPHDTVDAVQLHFSHIPARGHPLDVSS